VRGTREEGYDRGRITKKKNGRGGGGKKKEEGGEPSRTDNLSAGSSTYSPRRWKREKITVNQKEKEKSYVQLVLEKTGKVEETGQEFPMQKNLFWNRGKRS